MKNTGFQNPYPGRGSSFARMYSPNLQPLIQTLLSALADIDFEYECEREKIDRNTLDLPTKTRLLDRLKALHHERRMPYIRQLAILQKRISDLQPL
ncbi:MAG TPA: hypothetical protein VE423_00495 [Microvirga sp.]|nr:hypothetical protein [Microvirga sp.]